MIITMTMAMAVVIQELIITMTMVTTVAPFAFSLFSSLAPYVR